MFELTGWVGDVYESETGAILWLLCSGGKRKKLYLPLSITFYVAGPHDKLRKAWQFLKTAYPTSQLTRTTREDIFIGHREVMAVTQAQPTQHQRIFRSLQKQFPNLIYYDIDIPFTIRVAAEYGIFPLCYCTVSVDDNSLIHKLLPLDSAWDIVHTTPNLTYLLIEPDSNPYHSEPQNIFVTSSKGRIKIPLDSKRLLLLQLNGSFARHNPDIVLTEYGDTWLFPYLFEASREISVSFNPNRDEDKNVIQRKENSYFTYGHVVYRGQQTLLFGRWHVDVTNAMMYGEYGLHGVFEQARVSALPVQEVARKSPGAGISGMQMLTALKNNILVPYQKQQIEAFKAGQELVNGDRGGMVYMPLIGVHDNVVEVDFTSMYPSIIVKHNISPETIGKKTACAELVPELDIYVDQSQEGLIPKTLRPLLEKRILIKGQLATLSKKDCRYKVFKAWSNALKWLLVVCFGYLGYKNAKFGKIESHEAVTAFSRHHLLSAKEAAEDLGYEVVHMYVDGLYLKHPAVHKQEQTKPLLDEIVARTGLPLALEGIYNWIAFLPSTLNDAAPVPNRFFGVFQDGTLKTRGIEERRHDTPEFIRQVQQKLIDRLAQAQNGRFLQCALPDAIKMTQQAILALREGTVPLEDLLVTQTLSKEVSEYKVQPAVARAAYQLEQAGKARRPGQKIKFLHILGEPNVYVWDAPPLSHPATINVPLYIELLMRAVHIVLEPVGINKTALNALCINGCYQPQLTETSPLIQTLTDS